VGPSWPPGTGKPVAASPGASPGHERRNPVVSAGYRAFVRSLTHNCHAHVAAFRGMVRTLFVLNGDRRCRKMSDGTLEITIIVSLAALVAYPIGTGALARLRPRQVRSPRHTRVPR